MPELRPFWHRLSRKRRHAILAKRDRTWGQLAEEYRQPNWCGYPGAMHGVAGCWSLTSEGGSIRSIKDCGGCDCVCKNKATA